MRSSRKGTVDTALHLLSDSMRGGPPGRFVRDRAQHERLQAAAGRTTSRQLQDALGGGIGFHHAAMDAQDRALVEACFLDRSILARGLPARRCAACAAGPCIKTLQGRSDTLPHARASCACSACSVTCLD